MALAMLNRRTLLGGVGAIALAVGLRWLMESDHAGAGHTFEIVKDDGEWRRILTKAQYDVLRLGEDASPLAVILYDLEGVPGAGMVAFHEPAQPDRKRDRAHAAKECPPVQHRERHGRFLSVPIVLRGSK